MYRALSDGGPFTRVTTGLLTAPEYEDATVPEGTETVWYEVTATDTQGNESTRSSTLALGLVEQAITWAMDPGYPNPSRPGDVVTIPLVAPGGSTSAVLEIVNSAGQRVRRMELGALPPGPAVARWDGRSDGGREAAPGAYTAWLITGTTRMSVRLVRVP